MKKLILSMVAGLFVMAAATVAGAYMVGSTYHGLASIDPYGMTVVQVHSPASPLSLASSERIYLDSNKVWGVEDIRTIRLSETMAGKPETPRLYCFDFKSRFCANPF